MQQREDFEFGWDAVIGQLGADKQARSRQHRHFGMPDFVRLPAGKDNSHWLERPAGKHLAKGLNSHQIDYNITESQRRNASRQGAEKGQVVCEFFAPPRRCVKVFASSYCMG